MKKVFLLFAFFGALCLTTVEAQKSCSKAMSAKNGKTCCVVAAKAASLDNSIEKRVCSKSGTVSYVKKNVCSVSGKVSYADVEYCIKSSKFVNVSPSAAKTKTCTKGKAACTKKASSGSAMKVSNDQASAKAKKSCDPVKCTPAQIAACKKAGKTCTGAKASAAKAKLVKNEK